ncbi:tetratricopeptide repeat protein [Alkalibacillus haloalkaliphilus]|uniref:tetratricopeptide repeat protein n=1 Tax=Alkalibacillus haloalkaliphilus TaxID=94136 RepID=UPI002936A4E3|nr:tetratricopeptide repeat protein [Alkalibacillus haloalkaliphilus]MDV2581291.1 tetratricopeptide repeat protein [Alkalibacillus haloalkaliphilus]
MTLRQEAFRLKEEGKFSEAQSIFAELVQNYPDDHQVLIAAAYVHEQLEMFPQAITFYQQALDLELSEEERKEALLRLGISYRAVGLYDKAKETLEVGMSEYPSYNPMYVYFAFTLYNIGDYDLAMEIMAQKLLETTNDEDLVKQQELIEFYASSLDETFN